MKYSLLTRRQTLRLGAGLAATSFLGCASSMQLPVRTFDVATYGAIGDGATLDTAAIQRAIDEAAAAAETGTKSQVLLRGRKKYLVGAIQLRSGIDFHLADDAQILISTNPDDYRIAGIPRVAASQPTGGGRNDRVVFSARSARNLRISGTGTIDGRCMEFMDHYDQQNEWWINKPFRPPLFQFVDCEDLSIGGVIIKDSPMWTVHLLGCRHVLVDHLTIANQLEVPNCDGVNPDHCQDVEISHCNITCGDDGIAIKATRQGSQYGPTSNIRVHDCVFTTQDSGVKIGTETIQDVHDILIERCEIRNSCRGLTIQLRDEGNVYNVIFRDIKFTARYFSSPWWGRGEGISLTAIPRSRSTNVGTIHDVRIENVTGRCENSVRLSGSAASRIRDVTMQNVRVELDRWTKYPGQVWDNRPTSAMEALEQHDTSAISIRHADNITLKDCAVAWGANRPDYFTHALEAQDVTNLTTPGFKGEAAHPERDKAISIE